MAFLGGGSVIRPSACMRSNATRQLMSLSRPFARRQFRRSQTSRDSRKRLICGRVSNSRMSSISSSVKVASAVLHRSVRCDQAAWFAGECSISTDSYRRIQPRHSTSHAGLAVTLAPEVTAELAEHAHRLAQRRRLPGRGQCAWSGERATLRSPLRQNTSVAGRSGCTRAK